MLMNMLHIPGPTSNIERQRQFRERNPGYYRKYSARRRQLRKAAQANLAALLQAQTEKHEPLMLPAPAETIEISGMTMSSALPAPSPLPVSEQATIPPLAANSIAA